MNLIKEKIPIIDAHHHFWDLENNYYPFLSDKNEENFFFRQLFKFKKKLLT